MLTARAYRLAERRVRELPDQLCGTCRLHAGTGRVRNGAGGCRRARAQALLADGRARARRTEVRATVPGWSGQGEVWNGTWRWWSTGRVSALDFIAPRVGFLRGVSRVSGVWERQTYAARTTPMLETRADRRLHDSRLDRSRPAV